MTDAERLRKALNDSFTTGRIVDGEVHVSPQAFCRAIVEEFGLSREAQENAGLATYCEYIIRHSQSEAVASIGHELERAVNAVFAILDVAEGK